MPSTRKTFSNHHAAIAFRLLSIQEAFSGEAIHWEKSVLEVSMDAMLTNSCSLGLYALANDAIETPAGMVSTVTDYTTLACLADMRVYQSYQKLELG